MQRLLFSVVMSLAMIGLSSPSAMAVSLDRFTLNGFFDFEYEKADEILGTVSDHKGSFDQYHFNLLMGFQVTNALSVKGHVEYEHAPQLPSGKGDIKIEWSYLEYLLNDNLNLRLRAGMMLTPFGIYNEIHDATPTYLSIRTPWGIYKSGSVGGQAMFPKFSTGLFLRGQYAVHSDMSLLYVLYAANGENSSGANEAEKDDNSNKAVGGQVMFSPVSGLTVGGSYYTGKKGTASSDHSAWIGSIEYLPYPFGARAEYASAEIGNVTQNSWYGEVSYALGKWIPYLRWGMLDPDDDIDDNQWKELVYGVDYQIQDNFILKLENRNFTGETANTKVNRDYNEMAAALTVAF